MGMEDERREVFGRRPLKKRWTRTGAGGLKTSNGRNRESGRRIGSASPAMGILPWARTLKWRDELAAHTILPRSMGVNWAVNEPRRGCVT